MGVCTKERKEGVTAAVLMATPCTNSLGGELVKVGGRGMKEGDGGFRVEGCGRGGFAG